MQRPIRRLRPPHPIVLTTFLAALSCGFWLRGAAPPERTYSRSPFVHRIVILDEDGAVIRPPKPGEEASTTSTKPISLAKTCGKCHSDYDVMQQGWHFNFANPGAPNGRAGEPWILTDP